MHSERMALVGLLILHGFTGVASCIQIFLYTSQLSHLDHSSISMDALVYLSPVGNAGKKHRQVPLSASFCCATTMSQPYGWNRWAGSRAALELEKLEKEIPNEKSSSFYYYYFLVGSMSSFYYIVPFLFITRKPRT